MSNWKNTDQTVFTKNYAYYYDLFYKDKPYDKECDFVEALIKRFLKKEMPEIPISVLDLACGTGRHATILAQRGYQVTGTDFSKDMIEIAQKRAQRTLQENQHIDFHVMPMQETQLNKKFDVVMGMFHVFGYLTTYEDIQKMLNRTKEHMHDSSLLILDFWNGELVLKDTWPQKVKIFHDTSEGIARRMIRMSFTKLDKEKHIAQVRFHSLVLEKLTEKEEVTQEFEETHYMKYFFSEEIKNYLSQQGFEVLHVCPFMETDGSASLGDAWSGTIIAKKKKL